MRLIVRSQYWGPIIKGKATQRGLGLDCPYIIVQAVDDENENVVVAIADHHRHHNNHHNHNHTHHHHHHHRSGCCPEFGPRILSMEERHFLETNNNTHGGGGGDVWDLYQQHWYSSPTTNDIMYEFVLLPRQRLGDDDNDDNAVMMYANVMQQAKIKGWIYLGESQPARMRMDLARLLYPYFSMNKSTTTSPHPGQQQQHQQHLRYHFHIKVVMKQLQDRNEPFRRGGRNTKKVQNFCECLPSTTT